MNTVLHIYQCSFCKTTASRPYHDDLAPLKCGLCLRYMRKLSSSKITTPEQQALADRGTVFNPFVEVGPIKRMCDTCKTICVRDEMIALGVGGRYCSKACADIGTEKHRAAMEAMAPRLEALYQDQPWLRPQPKDGGK